MTCRPHSNEYNHYKNLIVEREKNGRARVRRLTPEEYEVLQGFPRGWTQVDYRGKPASDYQRYIAVGNSFPVPILRHLGIRLAQAHRRRPPG